MSARDLYSIAAGVLFVIGFIPYIRAILRKDNPIRPEKASWIIWISLDALTFIGMCFQKSVNGQIVGCVIGGLIVMTLAIIKGTSGWSGLDKFCLGGAILGILLWLVSSDPDFGIIIFQAATFIGSIPTFVSAWEDPSKEDKLAWTIFWLSCVITVILIPSWTIKDAAQPLNFLAIESIMMYILYVHRMPARIAVE